MKLRMISVAAIAVLLYFGGEAGVSAESYSWNTPAKFQIDEYDPNNIASGCNRDIANITDHEGINRGLDFQRNICIYNGKDYSIGRYVGYDNRYYWGVKLAGSSSFKQIEGVVPASNLYASPNSNRLIFFDMDRAGGQSILTSVENFQFNLETFRADEFNVPVSYAIKNSAKKHWLGYYESTGDRSYMPVQNAEYSLNGRYAVAWVDYSGHVKIDFELGTTTVITQLASIRQVSLYNPVAGAITNDGRYVFVNSGPLVYDTEKCGYELTPELIAQGRPFEYRRPGCSFTEYQTNIKLDFAGYPSEYSWVGDQDALRFVYRVYPYTTPDIKSPKVVTVWLKQNESSKLDYLALGDSYTSGEGDTGKNANGESYYTLGTNSERGCHLSSRAYPFLLAGLNNISPGRMQSVACSGAQMSKDYYGPSTLYFGQSNMLFGKSESELTIERTAALDNFSPGIVKQTDFVAANKPKVITLTGGGNDVGFGKIMSYCANIIHEKKFTGTCDYAQKGSKLHGLLANAIKGQYDYLKVLIDSIKTASPDTTIYVVGYPSFVASKLGCINDAALNRTEVDMLNASIAYMNEVLKKAAALKGAHFIDTKNSFHGGRICEGGTYVTGPAELIFGAKLQEAFHPNALGHEQLAGTIMTSGFSVAPKSNPAADDSIAAPTAPDYFSAAGKYKAEQRNVVPNTTFGRGQKILLSIPKLVLRPLSELTITLYSKPVNLGTGKVSSDGSFARDIVIPTDVSPGYHVLIVEGIDQEGNPIAFYQFIEVVNTGSDDLDGDGVKNDRDGCMYIQKWYDETTGKDICKVASIAKSLTGHGNGSGLGHDIGLGKGHQKDIELALPVSR